MRSVFYFFFFLVLTLNISAQNGKYVVLTNISDTTDAYYDAVRLIRDYRNAEVIQFTTTGLTALQTTLIAEQPRYAAIVMKPIDIDINFVRSFLIMSTNLDSDPFSDFSYGFITGAIAQDAIDFVNNIIYAEANNIQNYPLNIGGYAASSLNFVYPAGGDYMQYLNPPSGNIIYMETNDNNSGHDFFMLNTSYMEDCKVLDIGHNGDPHMLWLFEGGNTNPVPPIWNYDPAKVENPSNARTGLSSFDIVNLDLYPAVAFNGACHSGEPKKVMVEGDIAATFGETNGYTQFYTMSDTFSFCLSMLRTGVTGYFAPCGANNANDQGEDMYNAFLYDEPLGDIHKRSIDGVVMGFLGNRPALKTYVQGQYFYGCDVLASGTFDPASWSGACYMLGGKANRVYFGDPLFDPYENNHDPQLNITQYTLDSIDNTTLDINVTFNKPDATTAYFPVWDKFHHSNTRIYIPVELPAWCIDVTSISVLTSSGAYDLVVDALEEFDGKRILHIEVDIPDDMYDAINYSITLRIGYLSTGVSTILSNAIDGLEVYPNPATEELKVLFSNSVKQNITICFSEPGGKIVAMPYSENTLPGKHIIPLSCGMLKPGIYYLRLKTTSENIVRKIVIAGK